MKLVTQETMQTFDSARIDEIEESSKDNFPQWITSAPLINGLSRVLDEHMWVRTLESPTMLNLRAVDIAANQDSGM